MQITFQWNLSKIVSGSLASSKFTPSNACAAILAKIKHCNDSLDLIFINGIKINYAVESIIKIYSTTDNFIITQNYDQTEYNQN